MESIDIYQKTGCSQTGAGIVGIGFGVFFIAFAGYSFIMVLCALFFFVLGISAIIAANNNKLPIVKINPDSVEYRNTWLKSYKTLPFADIIKFEFHRYIQTSFGKPVNDQLRVTARLTNGKKKRFVITNPVEDTQTVAGYLVGALNMYHAK